MSVDTNGFVLTANKDVMLVGGLLQRALNRLVQAEKRLMFPERSAFFSEEAREAFKTCSIGLVPDCEMLDVEFTFRGENRAMKVFFNCDSDHTAYGPQSISLKLGLWGLSPLFMKTALHALSLLGQPYYDENDSDSIDPAPLKESTPSVLGAIKLGYLSAHELKRWVARWDAQGIGQPVSDFETFFGASESKLRALVGQADYKAAWAQISDLAEQLNVVPSFLEEYHRDMVGAL